MLLPAIAVSRPLTCSFLSDALQTFLPQLLVWPRCAWNEAPVLGPRQLPLSMSHQGSQSFQLSPYSFTSISVLFLMRYLVDKFIKVKKSMQNKNEITLWKNQISTLVKILQKSSRCPIRHCPMYLTISSTQGMVLLDDYCIPQNLQPLWKCKSIAL